MSTRGFPCWFGSAAVALLGAGCASQPCAYDYTNFRAHQPRSVLVLPPLNESTAVEATYSYLSTVTLPLAEHGYYVFPVAVIDRFFKENGMPTAGEMHQVPLDKVVEILGADAVLYITIKQYGTKYQIINSATTVQACGRLVDARTGLLLWEGAAMAQDNSASGSQDIFSALIIAVVSQVYNSSTDAAYGLCPVVNWNLLTPPGRGLLYGPYHPKFGIIE